MENQRLEFGARDNYGLEKLEGSVEQIIYSNEENGYTVCDMSTEDDVVTVCGTMPMLNEGDTLCVYGKWVHNAKYGRQFSVEQYERIMPADTASILRYLSSRAIKGIGPKTKEALLARFKSVKRIKEAPMEEIEALIGKSKAEALREGLGA